MTDVSNLGFHTCFFILRSCFIWPATPCFLHLLQFLCIGLRLCTLSPLCHAAFPTLLKLFSAFFFHERCFSKRSRAHVDQLSSWCRIRAQAPQLPNISLWRFHNTRTCAPVVLEAGHWRHIRRSFLLFFFWLLLLLSIFILFLIYNYLIFCMVLQPNGDVMMRFLYYTNDKYICDYYVIFLDVCFHQTFFFSI